MFLNEALPYISVVLALLGFWVGRMSASKSEGERDGAILTELNNIKAGIEDIKKKQNIRDEQYIGVMTRLSAVEASAKQAHRRIDEIREHCCGD